MPVFSIDRSIIYVIRNILCFINNIILLFLANNDNLICIVLIIVLLIYSTGRIKKMYEEKKNMKTLSPDECLEDAELLKALANPTRLSIVNHLLVDKCNVIAIETSLGVKQSNVSRHLFVLKSAGIVEGKREGNEIYYEVINQKVIKLVELLVALK